MRNNTQDGGGREAGQRNEEEPDWQIDPVMQEERFQQTTRGLSGISKGTLTGVYF